MKKYDNQPLVDCYLKHHSSVKAGKELGISPSTVCRAVRESGIALDGQKYSPKHGKTGRRESTKHGTRTMYVHYGCRCDECCKAEHRQYLKRKEAQNRRRRNSKWSDDLYSPTKKESQLNSDRNRYKAYTQDGHSYHKRIRWYDIAEQFGMKCAVCGCEVDPTDKWVNKNGCDCYGRRYPTVDHIIPLKYGGTDTFDNVQLVCKRCNSLMGGKDAIYVLGRPYAGIYRDVP